MNQQKINYLISAAIVVLALVMGYFGVTLPVAPVIPDPLEIEQMQAQIETLKADLDSIVLGGDALSFSASSACYKEQGGASWVAGSGCTWTVASGGAIVVSSGGSLDVTGALGVIGTDYALTGTQTLTPTASSYLIDSASVVTMTLGAGTDGDIVFLTNASANNVTIVDTGATSGGGNRTLGENDFIGFIYEDAKWIEAFYSDNS